MNKFLALFLVFGLWSCSHKIVTVPQNVTYKKPVSKLVVDAQMNTHDKLVLETYLQKKFSDSSRLKVLPASSFGNLKKSQRERVFLAKGVDGVLEIRQTEKERIYVPSSSLAIGHSYGFGRRGRFRIHSTHYLPGYQKIIRRTYHFELRNLRNGQKLWVGSTKIDDTGSRWGFDSRLKSMARRIVKKLQKEAILVSSK